MKNTAILLLALLPAFLFAQESDMNMGDWGKPSAAQHIGVVSGRLIDAEGSGSLAFANVRLFRFNDILLEGTITDEDGKFEFDELALANGYLLINYMGYEETRVDVTLNRNKKVEYLRKIKVKRSAVSLEEVAINEDKPIYELKMEKIIYNAENDLNESLDDAADVLRKTPLLSVDMEGEVSLRGSKNVKFLVNGKESTFFSGNPADALKMIPADEIKSVEVITSPTAKYDGEGQAGIINIVTKGKQITGFNATVNGSFGTRVNRQSFNLNIGKGKIGFSSRAMLRYGWPLGGQGYSFTENTTEGTTFLQQYNTLGQWIGFGGNSEIYYDINPYNSIVSSFGFRGQKQTGTEWAKDSLYTRVFDVIHDKDPIVNLLQGLSDQIDTTRITDSRKFDNTFEWTTDYVKKFADHEDRELRMAFQLGGEVHDDDTWVYNYQQRILQDSTINKNDALPLSKTLQLDYTHPIEDKHTIEFGGKYIDRDMVTHYSTLRNGIYTQSYEQFDYNQKVKAAYLNTKWELSKEYSLIAGVRLENTTITGQWNSQVAGKWEPNKKIPVTNNYTTLLPSFILNKKIDMMSSVKLSYGKRLSRPGIHYINTNTVPSNELSREVGNPELSPSIMNNIELGYNNFGGKYKGSYYIFFKKSQDLIESYLTLSGDTALTQYRNIGENNTVGLNYYGSVKFGDLSFRGGFNLFTFQTTSESLGVIQYNWNMGGNYDLGNNYKAETWGFFRSPTRTTQGYIASFSMVSVGFKKEFNNKKGSIGIRIIEPFKKYKDFESELEGDGFYQYSNRQTQFRSIGISFKYTFGEMKFRAIKKKTSISNDDLMEEGGDEGGM